MFRNEHVQVQKLLNFHTLFTSDVRFCKAYTFIIIFFSSDIFASTASVSFCSMLIDPNVLPVEAAIVDCSTLDNFGCSEYSSDFCRFDFEPKEESTALSKFN